MRLPTTFAIALATAATVTLGATFPAQAACKKMGFVVNDYGKDGPTRDAKELLEKDVARWAAEKGIKTYTLGKKEVSCYQFLNFIVFDEHTCTASATVCWDEKAPAGKPAAAQEAKADGTAAPVDEKPAPEKAAAEAKPEAKPVTKKVEAKPAAVAETPVVEETPVVKEAAAEAKPVEVKPVVDTAAADAKQPEEKANKVETGAVPTNLPDVAPAVAPAVPAVTGQAAKAAPPKDPSQIAAEAAERAAAAAERAAVAAERAAQAAMDAHNQNSASAAAKEAVAAPAVVQPITPLPATAKP